jgi:phosphoribosylformimino-5-aminoimidazole carboxamide ribotide isomerase
MQILPAIDILSGKVVRLFQGDYSQSTSYHDDPQQIAQTFQQQGYNFLHIIDLSGAKSKQPEIKKEIASILSLDGLRIQVGGGIRTIDSAQAYFDMGVSRIIIGTQALIQPHFIDELLTHFPADFISVSLDTRHGKLGINGWTEEHPLSIEQVLKHLDSQGVKHVIITDITRDGTLLGVDQNLYHPLVKSFPHLKLYAAGGVASHTDIAKLKACGLAGTIIGKAFYENNMRLIDERN